MPIILARVRFSSPAPTARCSGSNTVCKIVERGSTPRRRRLRSDLAGVKIRRPPRSRTGQGSRRRDSNSTCDATRVVCSQNAPAILRDERRAAARAGFEPAVGRLTAACVSASPPGNASRRARHVARNARRRHVLSNCQRSETIASVDSRSRAKRVAGPEGRRPRHEKRAPGPSPRGHTWSGRESNSHHSRSRMSAAHHRATDPNYG